ncbi:MAG TPA: ATP-grasp domain-containing protein [Candidatus Polarisedimenticolia bacterium]|nr:ATP-grasp domain-containing protein [Candidatus Polarisedimenticolia bacterium]
MLLPTTTYRAHDFIEAATKLGAETVVGSDQSQALQDLQPTRGLTIELRDPVKSADQIAAFAARHPLSAVIPTDDETAVVAAVASARLGLPHNPPGAAHAARRKDELRRLLEAAGVRTPRHAAIGVGVDPAAAARGQVYPVVLKPTFLAASRGVIRADTPDQFTTAFRRIESLLARPDVQERGGDDARRILVEQFVPGLEVAVEGLLTRGELRVLAIFDKPDPLDGPYFEETIYVTPSRLEAAAQRAVTATTVDAARALGLREGPIHAELRLNDRGPWLIELAARSIGGLCSRVLRFGTGLSLEEVILEHALGRDVSDLQREPRPAGVMMIPIPRAGVLRGVSGVREARAVAGIDDVTISATLGRPLVPLPEGASYLGFIFARADMPAAVEAALREAHGRLRFDIDPGA